MTSSNPAGATGANSTEAVPQPTLRGEPHPEECEILLIRHGRSADVVPGSAESTHRCTSWGWSKPPAWPSG